MKTAHRYILQELLPLFGICVVSLTFVFLINKVFLWMDLVLNKGVPFWDVLRLYVSIVPFFLAMTVPMSALLATLLALGRLASDMEVTAFKSSGVHMMHLLAPVLAFGLVLTAVMLYFNHRILPASNFMVKKMTYRIVSNKANVAIKERVFIDQFQGCQIYIDRQEKNGVLADIKVFMRKSANEPLQTVLARTGKLVTNPDTLQVYLHLKDGVAITVGPDEYQTYNQLYFRNYQYHLNLSDSLTNLSSLKKDFLDMDLDELKAEQKATTDAGWKQRLAVEYQKRLSLPFACLVVTWVSGALGLWFRRGGFLAFAYGVVLVFIYYLLFVMGEAMSLKRGLDPVVGIWGANVLFAVLGILMVQIVINERSSYMGLLRLFTPRRQPT